MSHIIRIILGFSLVFLAITDASAISGDARGTFSEKLTVKACDSREYISAMTVSFSEDQTWRAEARSGYLEGTYQVTKPGKLATLSLDPDVARSAIEASASDLCSKSLTIRGVEKSKATARLDKSTGDVKKVKIKISYLLTDGIDDYKATYKLSGKIDTGGSGGGAASNVEDIPNARIEPVSYIDSSDQFLYLRTWNGIVELDKTTWEKRTIVGNTLSSAGGAELETYLGGWKFHIAGDYVYSDNSRFNGNIFRASRRPDGLGGIDILLPDDVFEGCCNFGGITGNSTALFYNQYAGDTSDIYRIDYATNGPSEYVGTFSGDARDTNGEITVLATDSDLFILEDHSAFSRRLTRHHLLTGENTTIQAYIGTVSHPEPLAVNDSQVFWYNGDILFSADFSTNVPVIVHTGIARVRRMVADNNFVYVLQGPTNSTASTFEVFRIEIATGAVVQLTSGEPVRDITLLNGELYAVVAQSIFQIYRLDAATSPQLVFQMPPGEITSNGYQLSIRGSGDDLVVANANHHVVRYNLVSDTFDVLYTHNRSDYLHVQDGIGYVAASNLQPGISEFPVTPALPIRQDERLFEAATGENMLSIDTYVDNGYFYWTWRRKAVNSADVYNLSRIPLDGGGYELLYSTQEMLGDVAVLDGLVYFTCMNSCGAPGWVLASMPVTGGTPVAELALLLEPSLELINGIIYVADTADFRSMSLFSVNVAMQDVQELLTGLYYGDVYIRASDQWLYISENKDVLTIPYKRLRRFPLIAWNKIGGGQTIVDGSGDEVVRFSPESIHTDGQYLYYWHDAIKRLAE